MYLCTDRHNFIIVYALTQTQTQTHTHRHRHKHTQKHRHTDRQTHTRTHTHTCSHSLMAPGPIRYTRKKDKRMTELGPFKKAKYLCNALFGSNLFPCLRDERIDMALLFLDFRKKSKINTLKVSICLLASSSLIAPPRLYYIILSLCWYNIMYGNIAQSVERQT